MGCDVSQTFIIRLLKKEIDRDYTTSIIIYAVFNLIFNNILTIPLWKATGVMIIVFF